MIRILRFLPFIFLSIIIQTDLSATHNRAGEIIIRHIDGVTIEATIITYTKASSVAADRDSLTICWGDGDCELVSRSNGPTDANGQHQGEIRPNDIKYNLYIATHTYPGPDRYKISMTDPNRNGGIWNVNPPGSENVQFHLQTVYTFLSPQFQGTNDTPILLQPPISPL